MIAASRSFRWIVILLIISPCILKAQDNRVQYPPILRNSYFGVNIGSINYKFSAMQLQPGNKVGAVNVPHAAVRIILFGHQFNKFFGAQISYMRPVGWVEFNSINDDNQKHTVWMNLAGLTLTGNLPINKNLSLNLEGGLVLMMRRGFQVNNQYVVRHATYSTGMFGAQLRYHVNKKWDLQAGWVHSPSNDRELQPSTNFISAGFNYNMRELPAEKVAKARAAGYYFPKQIITAGFATSSMGYGVNKFVSQGAVPIFWGGEVKVKHGFTLNYQRNIFHAKKVFALDWSAGFGVWKSRRDNTTTVTVSAFPIFRFTILRSQALDFYGEYSVAGPTFISTTNVDGNLTGENFTFQDIMGFGVFAGKKKNLNLSARIAHYSNGNLFPQNNGYMIPVTFGVGYVF